MDLIQLNGSDKLPLQILANLLPDLVLRVELVTVFQ
jgi:hypothetical protein